MACLKKMFFGSLAACLLLLSSGLTVAQAHGYTNNRPEVQAKVTSTPISLQRLKALVRQTLGQKAVDNMGQLITQPLSVRSSTSRNLSLNPGRTSTSSRLKPHIQEQYSNDPLNGGYITNAEGVSWVQGAAGFFNVATPTLPSIEVETAVVVANSDGSSEINLGVAQTESDAYLSFHGQFLWVLFHVNTNDQMDAEIYWDANTNNWLLFIEDLTTRQSFGQEFSYSTTLTRAAWTMQVENGGPVPSMTLVTFTNAQWFSNWDGWQPIISPAAATYTQVTIKPPKGGVIWPTEVPDPPGTSFTMIPCPGCS